MISIIMPFLNRKSQFLNTLAYYEKTYSSYDYEIVVVDDASKPDQRLDNLETTAPLRVIRITEEEKNHSNPCVPFNRGFREARGDIFVLQSPECLHAGDVLGHILANLTDNECLVYGCWALSKEQTALVSKDDSIMPELVRQAYVTDRGWYIHSIHRRKYYHFLSALHAHHVHEMGGFDERYKDGCGYDDDEFVERLRRKGLSFEIIMDPICFHQWHPTIHDTGWVKQTPINQKLYYGTTLKESGWVANQ